MRFRQRAAWAVLFLYLACGFLCLHPLLGVTKHNALLRVDNPSGNTGKLWARFEESVPTRVLLALVGLLYIQGFALLFAFTRQDARAHVAKTVFPFVLCTLWKHCRNMTQGDGGEDVTIYGLADPLMLV